MKWSDVTVGQYQQLAEIGKMELSDLEATHETISILFGLTINQVRQLKPLKMAKYVEQLGFLKTEIIPRRRTILYCKGYFYGVDYTFTDFQTSKYIESKYFMQDFVGNIHNLLAVYTHRLKYGIIKKKPKVSDFEKDAERLKAANIEEAMGVLVFFLSSIKQLDENYTTLFGIDQTDGEGEPTDREGTHPFLNQYGWIYQAHLVSEFERVSLDDVYKMSAMHFLNDLAYLKAKDAHDDYLNKKARGAKIS